MFGGMGDPGAAGVGVDMSGVGVVGVGANMPSAAALIVDPSDQFLTPSTMVLPGSDEIGSTLGMPTSTSLPPSTGGTSALGGMQPSVTAEDEGFRLASNIQNTSAATTAAAAKPSTDSFIVAPSSVPNTPNSKLVADKMKTAAAASGMGDQDSKPALMEISETEARTGPGGDGAAGAPEHTAYGTAAPNLTSEYRALQKKAESAATLEISPHVLAATIQVVQESMSESISPLVFGQYVKCALMHDELQGRNVSLRHLISNGEMEEIYKKSVRMLRKNDKPVSGAQQLFWGLNPDVEYALVDAIMIRICAAEAPNSRLVMYLRELIMLRIISSFSVLRAVVVRCKPRWPVSLVLLGEPNGRNPSVNTASTSSTPMSPAVNETLLKLAAQMLPWYNFKSYEEDTLGIECGTFLAAVHLVVETFDECMFATSEDQLTAPGRVPLMSNPTASLLKALMDDRIIAVARACGRRFPDQWTLLENASTQIIEFTTAYIAGLGKNPSSAFSADLTFARQWQAICTRLRDGLAASVRTPFTPQAIKSKGAQVALAVIITWLAENTTPILGRDVTNALKEFFLKKEPQSGDVISLKAIEHACTVGYHESLKSQGDSQRTLNDGKGANGAAAVASKHVFKDQIRMCDMFVKQLSEVVLITEVQTDRWLTEWGGYQRLQRLIRDVLPQVESQLNSTFACLAVASAIAAVCAMCLGSRFPPVGVVNDLAPDGTDGSNRMDDGSSSGMDEATELASAIAAYSVQSLKVAAISEEVLPNRSFGLFLIRQLARCGSLLGRGKCNFPLAVRVLRAWDVINGGKPFSDATLGLNGVEMNQTSVGVGVSANGVASSSGIPGGVGASAAASPNVGIAAAQAGDRAASAATRNNSSLSAAAAIIVLDACDILTKPPNAKDGTNGSRKSGGPIVAGANPSLPNMRSDNDTSIAIRLLCSEPLLL